MVKKLSLNRKVSPKKDHGQKKISSYFAPTTSKLFTTVGDGVSTKSLQKSAKTRETSGSSDGTKKLSQKLDMDSQGLSDMSSDSDNEICESQPPCKEESKCISTKDEDCSPDFIPPTPKIRAKDKTHTLKVPNFPQIKVLESHVASCNSQDSAESSFNSEEDVIEGTPEVGAKFKRFVTDDEFDCDPDILPPTPQAKPVCMISSLNIPKFSRSRGPKVSLSLLSSKSLNARKQNILKPKLFSLKSKDVSSKTHLAKLKNEPLQKIVNINEEIPIIKNEADNDNGIFGKRMTASVCDKENKDMGVRPSVKRPAVTGTGISPDPKRVVNPDKSPEVNDINQCKLNLITKFNCHSPSVSGSESDGSFSLLQGSMLSHKGVKNNLVKNSCVQSGEALKIEDDKVTENSVEELISVRNIINETIAINGEDDIQSVSDEDKDIKLKSEEDVFKASQEFTIDHNEGKDESFKDGNNIPVSDFDFEDSLANMLGEDLASSFEKMSPFKEPVSANATENKTVRKILSEGLGADSFAVRGNFGRHIVTSVERRPYEGLMVVQITSLHNEEKKTCSLRGFWAQSAISEGDIVHILFTKDIDGHYTIDNNQGIIVINPDYLISGTSIVSAVFCRRKSVLNERFRGMDSGNKSMLIGSLVHQLFQDVVKDKITSRERLETLMRQLVSHPKMLCEMYGLSITEVAIYEEMSNYLPRILSWSQRYLGSGLVQMQGGNVSRKNQWQGNILEVNDIEENIWSPKFGVKGKIDLTVKTRSRGSTKVVPLELKTGRSSFSAEHRGQVTLYSMMSADRREDPQSGLLLYLKDGAMEEVPAGEKEKKGLIQLRNEMIYYLTAHPTVVEGSSIPKLPNLPEPISFERACSRCAHLLTCSVYRKSIEEITPDPSHAMSTLIPQATGHLMQSHLDYFRLWCLLLHLEIAVNKKDGAIRNLWCQDGSKREASGDCLSSLILDSSCEVQEHEAGYFLHTFIRSPCHPNYVNLEDVGLQASESVVISSQTELALCVGVISSFRNGGVCVIMDRNLKDYPNWRSKIFVVDRCEYQNTMSINFTNIARLLMDTPRATVLRSLIIDKTMPSFKKGLPQEVVSKGKHILKRLNKIQQRAVLRTLMADDYSLLKGFPGTGKTSTIVALVELMVALGHSVLLTSYTHSAVDNILLKLKSLNIDFLRLGRIARIHPDLTSYADEAIIKDFKDVASLSEFYANKLVIASTCLGANHVLFTKRTFDFCIVDEASQVLQAAALGPLFHASRFVLVGDPQQLPPVIQSSQAKDIGMSESLFVRLDSMGATSCLTEQYRMNGQIMKLANCLMYEGQLKCANAELEGKTLDLQHFQELAASSDVADWVRIVLDPSIEHSVVFMDTCGHAPEERDCAKMIINSRETACVLVLIKALLKAGVCADDIGVITPYRAQVKNISNHVKKEVEMGHRVEVNTVDQYQGRDKSVIVYSCVRSGILQAESGEILQDERRLNVAITRAKYKLIMIGDMATLQLFNPFKKLTDILESSQVYKMKHGTDGFSWSDPGLAFV